MSDKHTPGPWRIIGRWLVVPEHGVSIADTYHADRDTEECSANAALIAAAPELLAALKEMREANKGHGYFGPAHPAVQQMEAAIAKAEAVGS